MPRSTEEVDILLGQLHATRDKVDVDSEIAAVAREDEATAIDEQVVILEANMAALDRDDPGWQELYRELSAAAGAARQAAARERMNAARLRSLNHADEVANGVEICVFCKLKTDDRGDVVGTLHIHHNIEDKVRGAITFPGLRSMLTDESADVDVDGRLVIDGKQVGRRPSR